MQNEKLFMKMLQEIVEIARVNDNSITTKEVDDYFSELDLDDKQIEAIYDYLCKGHIKVVGYTNLASDVSQEDDNVKDAVEYKSDKDVLNSVRTKHYRKNVRDLTENTGSIEEIFELYKSDGNDEKKRENIIKAYLPVVLNYSSRYAGRGVATDELIQEGNLAIILAVDELLSGGVGELKDSASFDVYIRNKIRTAIIATVDNEMEDESELQAAVGKAQLIKEAASHLAKELGRVASLRELSEFAHLPEEEIEDIIRFSGNIVSLGDGNDLSDKKE